MSDTRTQVTTVERTIAAPPDRIFDLVADPRAHVDLDGSGTLRRSVGSNPARLRLGACFSIDMRLGPLPYRMVNRVVEFEANHLIAWRHLARHRWRFELDRVKGGTRVRHSFDWSTAISPFALEVLRVPEANRRSMEATLERLDEMLTRHAPARLPA